jgi:hypothetical protein
MFIDNSFVGVISEALIREYLTKLNLFTVLKVFDETREITHPQIEIKTRKSLYETLHLTNEMRDNHLSSVKLRSVLEVLVKSHLTSSFF